MEWIPHLLTICKNYLVSVFTENLGNFSFWSVIFFATLICLAWILFSSLKYRFGKISVKKEHKERKRLNKAHSTFSDKTAVRRPVRIAWKLFFATTIVILIFSFFPFSRKWLEVQLDKAETQIAFFLNSFTPEAVSATESDKLPIFRDDIICSEKNNNLPNWTANTWGSSDMKSKIVVDDGHNDNCSLKLSVKNYESGDSKWMFDPTPVESDKSYLIKIWYKTSDSSALAASIEYHLASGESVWSNLPKPKVNPDTDGEWQLYEADFTVIPENVVSASAAILMKGDGYLQTDEYEIENYHYDLMRPLLSINFDDGDIENVWNALPILEKYRLPATHYYVTFDFTDVREPEALRKLANSKGQEIGSHTINHSSLIHVGPDQLHKELVESRKTLEDTINMPVNTFAYPYGNTNTVIEGIIQNYYTSSRGVIEGYNGGKNFHKYSDVRVRNVYNWTTAEEISAWIKQASKNNAWIILLYHKISENPGEFDTATEVFDEHMKAIVDSGITVKNYSAALYEVDLQTPWPH